MVVFLLTIHHFATRTLKPTKSILVKTIAAQPIPRQLPPVVAQALPQAPVKQTAPSIPTSAPPAAKKMAPVSKATNPPAPKKGPIATKKEADTEGLNELAKSLEALSVPTFITSRPTLTIPSKLPPRTETAAIQIEEPNYAEYLVAFLQETLALPEFGEVKAKLHIDRFGNLISCEILEARSKKNAEFLKNQLQDLTFPCFNESKTFTITFRNVD